MDFGIHHRNKKTVLLALSANHLASQADLNKHQMSGRL
jgi:hypothetical protein